MLGASILVTVSVLAQAVLATPVARSVYTVKETHYVPQRWTQKGRAPKQQMLALQIGVKQGNFDELERNLYEGKFQDLFLPSQKLILYKSPTQVIPATGST
jgi:tripeptidyl-peptidase-1